MPYIRTSRSSAARPPRWPYALNADHWSARGLVGLWPLFGPEGLHDLTGRQRLTSSSATGIVFRPHGVGAKVADFVGTSQELFYDDGPVIAPFPLTMMTRAELDARNADSMLMSLCDNASGTQQQRMEIFGSGGNPEAMTFDGTVRSSTEIAITLGVPFLSCSTFESASHRNIHIDGVAGGANTTTATLSGTFDSVSIGRSADSTPVGNLDGRVWDARIYSRVLSTDEMLALTYDPAAMWGAYYELGRKTIFLPAAGGGGATADVPSGSITATGQLPSINTGERVAAPAGALTLTAQLPGIETGVRVATPAGALTLTAQLPAVRTGTAVAVPTGGMSFAGQLPGVNTGVAVAAPAGALTLTGQLPTIDAAVETIVQVPAGSITLTGALPAVSAGAAVDVPTGSLQFVGALPAVLATAGHSGVIRLALSEQHGAPRAPSLADVGRRREELRARTTQEQQPTPLRPGDFVDPESGAIVRAPAPAKPKREARTGAMSGRGIDAPIPVDVPEDLRELAELLHVSESARRRKLMSAALLLYYAEVA